VRGPFDGREDRDLVLRDLATLMAMPSAGDLVIYGTGAPEGNVSYIPEVGAHAGPSPDELHTFIVAPSAVTVPAITHPIQLYDLFLAYQEPAADQSREPVDHDERRARHYPEQCQVKPCRGDPLETEG
jgi:hypothetical protein